MSSQATPDLGPAETPPNVTVRMFESQADRSQARNEGAHASRSRVLLFLDADMEVTEGLLRSCVDSMTDHDAACIREITLPGKNYWARARALERDAYFRSLYFEAARVFRREVFESSGGYNPRLTGIEDIDLQARLIESGGVIGWIDTPVLHHEETIDLRRYLGKRNRYGHADSLFAALHPDYWTKFRSLGLRFGFVFKRISRTGPVAMLLVPGLVLTRFAEFLTRTRY